MFWVVDLTTWGKKIVHKWNVSSINTWFEMVMDADKFERFFKKHKKYLVRVWCGRKKWKTDSIEWVTQAD